MFDLIGGNVERPLKTGSPRSRALSIALPLLVTAAVAGLSGLLYRGPATFPELRTTIVFVSPPPTSPLPPPAPPLSKSPRQSTPKSREATGASSVPAVPRDAPTRVSAEPVNAEPSVGQGRVEDGMEGGVEGGIPGGVVNGIVGGMIGRAVPMEAPPPSPPSVHAPVHVGGQIKTPKLLRRVEPIYPDAAATVNLTGVVILEAVVDTTGCVTSVKVLRGHPLLSQAATTALSHWQYEPLLLNGTPAPFVLTVTFTFSTSR